MIRLRRAWFQIHKWLGITLAILIIPLSLTGAVLVWHDWLDEQVNPQRYPIVTAPLLEPSAYASSAAKLAEPGERIADIDLPVERGSVQVTLVKPAPDGRPQRAWVWLDPKTAEPIERAVAGEGLLRTMHIIHGSLMIPDFGRKIVGWVGIAMLISSLTGLWLWWPLKGKLTAGFRWKRRPDFNSNLHHLGGFWIAIPLAVLSFTGVWICFPAMFSVSVRSPPQVKLLEQPNLNFDRAMEAAQLLVHGRAASISWPTDEKPEWAVTISDDGKPQEVRVADSDAGAKLVPPRPETLARTMRRIHDGTGMPLLWKIVIFVGGILPAVLAVTGILMWLRMRGRRARHRRKMGDLVEAEALAS